MYRIYTKVNLADTSRDPDDIIIKELCYKKTKKEAKEFCNKYISKKFFNKDSELYENNGIIHAIDFCSYGETIIAKKIKK